MSFIVESQKSDLKLKSTTEKRGTQKMLLNKEPYQEEAHNIDKIYSSKKALIIDNDFDLNQLHSLTDRINNERYSTSNQYDFISNDISKDKQVNNNQNTDRVSSYTTGSTSEYQFLIYENKIHLLNDRLQCYMQEVQNLKKTNAILISKLSTIEALDDELQNEKLKNLQLRQQVQIYRDKLEDEKDEYERKIKQLKTQLQEKDSFLELMREQDSKIAKKKDQQITFLREALKEKTIKLQSYEKRLHYLQIQRLNTSEDLTERDSLFARNSIASQNSQNFNMMNQSNISVEQKAKQFMKKNQNELKIAMKSISHAQKCLEIGGHEISTIVAEKQNEKSMMNASLFSKSKINKTYFK